MKAIRAKHQLIEALTSALNRNKVVSALAKELAQTYEVFFLAELSSARRFNIRTFPSTHLTSCGFYQLDYGLSEEAIEISHVHYDAYLWKEDNHWCLDADHETPYEIARQLSEAPVFNKVPENVKHLLQLLQTGEWVFSEHLPKFEGEPPRDTGEVISWDSNHILTGTRLNNLNVMTRREWDQLTHNENHWFDE